MGKGNNLKHCHNPARPDYDTLSFHLPFLGWINQTYLAVIIADIYFMQLIIF